MTNQEIRDNAPDGATHFTSRDSKLEIVIYFKWLKHDQYATWLDKSEKWSDDYRPIDHIHSLSDIKRIVELEKQIEFKIKECMELSQSCNRYKSKLLENKND